MSILPSSPEYAAERAILSDLLRRLPVGAVLSYREASEAIGRNVQTTARPSLLKAIEIAEKEDGTRRYATVAKQGIKRLSEIEMPSIGVHCRQRVRRAVRKAYRRLETAKVNDPAAEIANRTQLAHLGALALAAQERHQKKLDDAVKRAEEAIPAAMVLRMFVD